ncbi:DNA-directed RNA polymerase [Aeromonas phage T7-Ah]|uniref:DNA-directed RNA polymerase n=1 Tax=Aeromonas phage T7-Ah TaxID=2759196 RepID=A0A7S6HSA1_9CAUD|nr:DNA-directed RNA polymerase [Aeromonas phage T7-Ah]
MFNQVARNDFSDISNAVMPFNTLANAYGETLAAEQLRLEHESYVMGEERFRKALERQIERGEFTDNATAKPLLDKLVPALGQHIESFLQAKGRGRPHVSKKYLSQIEPMTTAFITVKTVLTILAKEESVAIQRVAMAISRNVEDEIRYGRIRDEEAEHFKSKVKNNLDKRQGVHFKKAYMQAVEAGMLEEGQLQSTHDTWPKDEAFHVGVRLIELLIESTGMLTIERKFAGVPDKDHQAIHLTEEYVKALAGRAHALAGINPLYQPTIVPPKPWTGVSGGGYWAKGRRPLNLIRVGSKRALMRYAEVDMPEVYEAVNTIQNTAWKVNTDVLAVANMIVNWDNCPVEDIPSLNPLEKPERIEGMDENEELLRKWKRAAAAIYRKEKARQSRRISLEFILGQANKFSEYGAIWFPHNLDWRGRVYAVPMFNPQGNDMTKGLLTFAEGVEIGSEGAYWLAVHGANCAGVDKVSLDERVQWVKDNETMIIESAKAPLDCTWWAEQDSPFCFLAFCFEWAAFVASGRSESFVSHLPLAFDGTCSGLQHFSAMLRDEVGGAAVNLLPADRPQDVYGIVAKKVNEMLAYDVIHGTDDEMVTVTDKKTGEITEKLVLGSKTLAAQWLAFGVNRSVTKRSVMTLAYGSKQYGFADQVREDTVQPAIDKGQGDMFTIPSQACQYMAKLIWDSVSVTVVAAVEAMNWLQKAATLISTEIKDKKTGEIIKPSLPVHWCTPAGFPVWSEYRKQNQKVIDCVILGSMRLQLKLNMSEKPEIDAAKQASGIAPNFVHSMDASHLMLTANKGKRVYGITSFAFIHDSFGCHAGKAHLLFKAVRETMVETYSEHDVIAEFYNQFRDQLTEEQLDKMPDMPKKGNLDITKIMESKYTFS